MKAQFIELPAFERHRAEHLDDDAFSDQGRIGGEAAIVKASVEKKRARAPKRNLFAELNKGVQAVAQARKDKRTLRTHTLEFKPPPELTAKQVIAVRRSLNLSRPLFAAYLRTNMRTLENWEQGRAQPNAQAALLIQMVKRYPDTVERLRAI